MKCSMKTKMVCMGLGGIIGLAMLAVTSFQSYQASHVAMEGGAHRIKQMAGALDMKAAYLKLVLAATQSIKERQNGKVSNENMAAIREASSALMKDVGEFGRDFAVKDGAFSSADLSKKVESLNGSITKDLVELIEASSTKLAAIDQEFKKIHDSLVASSSGVASALDTFEAALQLKITLAASREESSTLKEGYDSLSYIRKAVNNLVIAAFESIIYKDTGSVSDKRINIITRDSGYLEANVSKLAGYAEADDEKTMVKRIQSDTDALNHAIREELVPLIKNGASEASIIRDTFQKFEIDLSRNTAEVASMLDRAANSSMVETERSMTAMKDSGRSTFSKSMYVLVISVLLIIPMILFMATRITGAIKRAADQMNESAAQVAYASRQLSAASQQLSEGASQQAAAIEETSSSLEEMASMTKQNAANANQANTLMNKTRHVVEQATGSMAHLTASMDEISTAGEATSKIIKTIDEIAFQTNLLALNAAVEAARAGEAGAGFAVVADEVRNLALRAAEAAKNTADLIEGTVKKTKEGSAHVQKTNAEFSEVQISAGKMGELIGEISAASNEQAQGIEQISKAVSEMDKVVQQNSANAEESASASEEMSAQAVQMKHFVDGLVALVRGADGHSTMGGATALRKQPACDTGAKGPKMIATYEKKSNGHHKAGNGKASAPLVKRNSGLEQVIPFDDKDQLETLDDTF